jgi:signal transduction histidine kinase/FixJ family two-component response regulator
MKLSISGKIILIAAIGVIASSVMILCTSTILMGRLVNRILYDDISAMQAVVARMQQQEELRLLQEMQLLTTMPQLVNAIHEADIERIREIAQMSWHRLGLDAITFTNANGIVLVRGHSDIRGDDLKNRHGMIAALNGEVLSGIFFEENALIPYAIRCYAPIFRDGVIVGAMTLATEIGTKTYVDNLHKISGMNFTLFKGDTIFVTSIVDKYGNRTNGTRLKDTRVLNTVLNNGEIAILRCEITGEPGMTAYWPIKDVNGNIMGMWAITMSLSHQNNEINRVLMIVILCSLGIMFLLVVAAGFLGNRMSMPIRKVTEYAVQVANGNLDAPLDVETQEIKPGAKSHGFRCNEVGLLVGALRTMVNTLKERIREMKDLMHEAEEQRAAAVEANKAKSSFLSTMSHEIRTPMNAILGITEIQLQNETLPNDIRDSLEKVYISGDMLLGIINDILDLSKIEAGKLELLTSKYDIASLICDTAQLNMMRIGSKPIEFELDVDENIPAGLFGDELRIKQIINNLLSNAFKYTASGIVKMSVTTEPCQGNDDEIFLTVSVSDTGQGMTKEQVQALFEEYSRFNTAANRSTEGTGLGMSITRNLIRMMNGNIHVESEPGKGSTFVIRLLQGKVGAELLGKEMAENLHLFRTSSRASMKRAQISRELMPYGNVLIVDDVETNIFVAKGLLTPYDLKIDTADSGFSAIEKVKNGRVYDIIFMDHMMPQMDGVEATKILREMGYDQPIVALTANAVAGQAAIFLENGFDDFISKPIDIRQMNVLLNKLIRDKQPPEVLEAARKQAEIKKEQASENKHNQSDDPHFVEIFMRDAIKSLNALTAIVENSSYNDNDMRAFIIHTHGLKSALTYIGKMELSATALKLEQLGRDKNIGAIKTETPAFLHNLNIFIEELMPMDETGGEIHNEDSGFLREKLIVIKMACEEYDEITANKAITELREKTWSVSSKELLSTIAEYLLHSDFDETVEVINKFLEQWFVKKSD